MGNLLKIIAASKRVVPDVITDVDVLNYIDFAEISDVTLRNAINYIIPALKANSLWSIWKALYLFPGKTAVINCVNAVDIRDADAACRLKFYNGWTHNKNGAVPNGVDAYADTFINHSNYWASTTNGTLAFYTNTNTSGGSEIGIRTLTNVFLGIYMRFTAELYYVINSLNTVPYQMPLLRSDGLAITSRNGTDIFCKKYDSSGGATNTNAGSTPDATKFNGKLYIGARNYNNIPELFSNKACCFSAVSNQSITVSQANVLEGIVNTYQKKLGRNAYT